MFFIFYLIISIISIIFIVSIIFIISIIFISIIWIILNISIISVSIVSCSIFILASLSCTSFSFSFSSSFRDWIRLMNNSFHINWYFFVIENRCLHRHSLELWKFSCNKRVENFNFFILDVLRSFSCSRYVWIFHSQ
jgi:hypothetical protein